MKKIKFQIIDHTDHQPLSDIYECDIDPLTREGSNTIYLVEHDSSIIRIGDIVMQPRRIHLNEDKTGSLVYGIPEGTGWSKTIFFETVKIISEG